MRQVTVIILVAFILQMQIQPTAFAAAADETTLIAHAIYGANSLMCAPDVANVPTDTRADSYHVFKAACQDYAAAKGNIDANVTTFDSGSLPSDPTASDYQYQAFVLAAKNAQIAYDTAVLNQTAADIVKPSFADAYAKAQAELAEKNRRKEEAEDEIDSIMLELLMWAFFLMNTGPILIGCGWVDPITASVILFLVYYFTAAPAIVWMVDDLVDEDDGMKMLDDLVGIKGDLIFGVFDLVPGIDIEIDEERGQDHHNDGTKGRTDGIKSVDLQMIKSQFGDYSLPGSCNATASNPILDIIFDIAGINKANACIDPCSCALVGFWVSFERFANKMEDLFNTLVELGYGKIHTHLVCTGGGTASVELERERVIKKLASSGGQYDLAVANNLLDRVVGADSSLDKYISLKSWTSFLQGNDYSTPMSSSDIDLYTKLAKEDKFKSLNMFSVIDNIIESVVSSGFAAAALTAGGAGAEQLAAWPIPETRVEYLAQLQITTAAAAASAGDAATGAGIELEEYNNLLADAVLEDTEENLVVSGGADQSLEDSDPVSTNNEDTSSETPLSNITPGTGTTTVNPTVVGGTGGGVAGEGGGTSGGESGNEDAGGDDAGGEGSPVNQGNNLATKNLDKDKYDRLSDAAKKIADDINERRKFNSMLLALNSDGDKGKNLMAARNKKQKSLSNSDKNKTSDLSSIGKSRSRFLLVDQDSGKKKIDKEKEELNIDFGSAVFGGGSYTGSGRGVRGRGGNSNSRTGGSGSGPSSNSAGSGDKGRGGGVWNTVANSRLKDKPGNQIHGTVGDLFKIVSRRYARSAYPVLEVIKE